MILGQGFFDTIFNPVTDSTIYFLMAAISSALIILKVIFLFLGGVDADIDIDVDTDVDADFGDIDSGFSMISVLSILAFLMGAGWMGLAARMEWQWSAIAAAGLAIVCGIFMMFVSSMGMYQMKKFNQVNKSNPESAIGQIGRVYVSIPAKGQGRGQIQITVDGKQQIMPAVQNGGDSLDSFTAVKVTGVQEGNTLIVEPQ